MYFVAWIFLVVIVVPCCGNGFTYSPTSGTLLTQFDYVETYQTCANTSGSTVIENMDHISPFLLDCAFFTRINVELTLLAPSNIEDIWSPAIEFPKVHFVPPFTDRLIMYTSVPFINLTNPPPPEIFDAAFGGDVQTITNFPAKITIEVANPYLGWSIDPVPIPAPWEYLLRVRKYANFNRTAKRDMGTDYTLRLRRGPVTALPIGISSLHAARVDQCWRDNPGPTYRGQTNSGQNTFYDYVDGVCRNDLRIVQYNVDINSGNKSQICQKSRDEILLNANVAAYNLLQDNGMMNDEFPCTRLVCESETDPTDVWLAIDVVVLDDLPQCSLHKIRNNPTFHQAAIVRLDVGDGNSHVIPIPDIFGTPSSPLDLKTRVFFEEGATLTNTNTGNLSDTERAKREWRVTLTRASPRMRENVIERLFPGVSGGGIILCDRNHKGIDIPNISLPDDPECIITDYLRAVGVLNEDVPNLLSSLTLDESYFWLFVPSSVVDRAFGTHSRDLNTQTNAHIGAKPTTILSSIEQTLRSGFKMGDASYDFCNDLNVFTTKGDAIDGVADRRYDGAMPFTSIAELHNYLFDKFMPTLGGVCSIMDYLLLQNHSLSLAMADTTSPAWSLTHPIGPSYYSFDTYLGDNIDPSDNATWFFSNSSHLIQENPMLSGFFGASASTSAVSMYLSNYLRNSTNDTCKQLAESTFCPFPISSQNGSKSWFFTSSGSGGFDLGHLITPQDISSSIVFMEEIDVPNITGQNTTWLFEHSVETSFLIDIGDSLLEYVDSTTTIFFDTPPMCQIATANPSNETNTLNGAIFSSVCYPFVANGPDPSKPPTIVYTIVYNCSGSGMIFDNNVNTTYDTNILGENIGIVQYYVDAGDCQKNQILFSVYNVSFDDDVHELLTNSGVTLEYHCVASLFKSADLEQIYDPPPNSTIIVPADISPVLCSISEKNLCTVYNICDPGDGDSFWDKNRVRIIIAAAAGLGLLAVIFICAYPIKSSNAESNTIKTKTD